MKNLILSLILTCIYCLKAAGQTAPIVDSTWQLPKAGDRIDAYDFYPNPSHYQADTGMNIQWNYQYVKLSKGSTGSIEFLDPASINVHCHSPQANMARGDSTFYACSFVDKTGFYQLESTNKNSFFSTMVFTKPVISKTINLSPHLTLLDTAMYYEINGNDSTYKGNVKISIKYDGFGRLFLDSLQFDSVVRIHFMEHMVDSFYSVDRSKYEIVNNIIKDKYMWFKKSSPLYLLHIYKAYHLEGNDTFFTDSSSYYGDYHGQPIILSPKLQDINITAHLTGNKLILHSDKKSFDNFEYSLYSIEGKLITTGNAKFQYGTSTVNMPNLKPAVYLIRIKSEKGDVLSTKVVKYE